MSLIEQAAKRLAELQRSGADLGAEPGVDGRAPSADAGPDVVPTPEALVRALEARGDMPGGRVEPQLRPLGAHREPAHAVAPAAATAPSVVRAPRARTTPPRHVDIDLERLKARGYLTPDAPKTRIADEFRVIKRPIIQNALGRNGTPPARRGNRVMVTSALPGEGKTFTAANLAMSIAMELDSTVLLIDGDVAHPGLPGLLGVPPSPGLLDLLTQTGLEVSEALVKTNVEKLSVIPAGTPHRRATELLASEAMGTLLDEIGSRYPDRIIIFDSPPLLATTEARVLAGHMGQIVVVVAAESTSQSTLSQALATVESCEIVLMMLNKASRTEVGTYGYYLDGRSD